MKAKPQNMYFNFTGKSTLKDMILNDEETKTRIGYKEVEEYVTKETKDRKRSAPLTTEEKIFLKFSF